MEEWAGVHRPLYWFVSAPPLASRVLRSSWEQRRLGEAATRQNSRKANLMMNVRIETKFDSSGISFAFQGF